MNNAPSLAQIEIIELPWMISTSVSNLQLTVVENGDCQLLLDTFWGHHVDGAKFRRVALQFSGVAATNYAVFRSDSERGGKETFDWPEALSSPRGALEFQEWLEARAARWKSAGVCPDPKFYQANGSGWAAEFGGQPKHFLLCGCDAFVEVLATEYSWSELARLEI